MKKSTIQRPFEPFQRASKASNGRPYAAAQFFLLKIHFVWLKVGF
jgi:hypothetical protein